jgi:hypothetical protein
MSLELMAQVHAITQPLRGVVSCRDYSTIHMFRRLTDGCEAGQLTTRAEARCVLSALVYCPSVTRLPLPKQAARLGNLTCPPAERLNYSHTQCSKLAFEIATAAHRMIGPKAREVYPVPTLPPYSPESRHQMAVRCSAACPNGAALLVVRPLADLKAPIPHTPAAHRAPHQQICGHAQHLRPRQTFT